MTLNYSQEDFKELFNNLKGQGLFPGPFFNCTLCIIQTLPFTNSLFQANINLPRKYGRRLPLWRKKYV